MANKSKLYDYIVIQNWMITVLKLNKLELIIFAIIYNYSQMLGNTFHGSLDYFQSFLLESKEQIKKIIKNLLQKRYIINLGNNVYMHNEEYIQELIDKYMIEE